MRVPGGQYPSGDSDEYTSLLGWVGRRLPHGVERGQIHRVLHITPGATLLGSLQCFRYQDAIVVLRANQHFGIPLDIGPYTDSFTRAVFEVRDIPYTYTALGIGLEWAPK